MTKEAFQNKLCGRYNRETWKQVMNALFPNRTFFDTVYPVPLHTKAQTEAAKEIIQFGSIELADHTTVALFEIELLPGKQIARNRSSLRALVSSLVQTGNIDSALVAFYEKDQLDWRFSYISKAKTQDENGNEINLETPPKRFTYVLGPNESCRTASMRFEHLANINQKKIQDILDAFSVETLSTEFFKKYHQQYEKFWNFIATNPGYSKGLLDMTQTEEIKQQKPIRDFVKRLLGRIVFLHFLQKKRWLGCPADSTHWTDGDPNFMMNLFLDYKKKDKFHSRCLTELFFNTLNNPNRKDLLFSVTGTRVPYLNGGLFDDDQAATNGIDFPLEYFEDLFNFFGHYNFTIDENGLYEHEVGIDPEMLGHIFENLLEENREKGTFYTPKEIVHYMCRESLVHYLRTHLPECKDDDSPATRAVENLIRHNLKGDESNKNFIYKNANRIEVLLERVKICDPAIGSGAFPMGLLQVIFEARLLLHWGMNRAEVKKSIIQNSIYGVDIEKGAVDIARLRFWLALVVDEEEPQPLPNLDYKIMQGNSLFESFEDVPLDLMKEDVVKVYQANEQAALFSPGIQMQIERDTKKRDRLQILRDEYFVCRDRDEKKRIHVQIDHEVHEHVSHNFARQEGQLVRRHSEVETKLESLLRMTITGTDGKGKGAGKKLKHELSVQKIKEEVLVLEGEIKELKKKQQRLEKIDPDNKPYFLWHLYFSEVFDTGGFDIVIGNPPYIQLQKDAGDLADKLKNSHYETFERMGDIYSLFYEKGWQLLKPQGSLCFITSNKWMRAGYGESTRKFFSDKTDPVLLIDFAGQKIFETATVDTNILLFSKEKNKGRTLACTVNQKVLDNLSVFIRQYGYECNFNTSESWVILSSIEKSIKNKIERIGTPLKQWDISINYGIKTGYNEAFIISGKTREELIKQDARSEEIIRPILRGRDVKRYGYDFADQWLISTHNGIKEQGIKPIDISDYPAIKKHLDGYYSDLAKRSDKGITPYNLRNCAYMEDFFKHKIIYPDIMRMPRQEQELKEYPYFYYDEENFFVEATNFMMTGENIDLIYLFLSSDVGFFIFSKFYAGPQFDATGFRYKKAYLEETFIPLPKEAHIQILRGMMKSLRQGKTLNEEINSIWCEIIGLNNDEAQLVKDYKMSLLS
jgi:hypothetical protein